MAKLITISIIILILAYILFSAVLSIEPQDNLNSLAIQYSNIKDVGAANLVTAIVVTYRGFDTLGEVAVLFIASLGVGLLLSKNKNKKSEDKEIKPSTEILKNGMEFLLPIIFLFGIYIFVHGHLTPGGGFQGGVVIASGFALLMICCSELKLNKGVLYILESFSAFFYILLGFLGLVLAGGFLDNEFICLGTFGKLFSAGAIPLIYSFIGIKVGSEFVGILDNLKKYKVLEQE